MLGPATCTRCGAELGAGSPANGRCDTCGERSEETPLPPPSARVASSEAPTRRIDEGRILRTGAHRPTATQPVGTMPRLMTADVEAAAAHAAPPANLPEEDLFTLSEATPDGATSEQWSLGNEVREEDQGAGQHRPKRAAVPKGLFAAAGLLATLVVGAIVQLSAQGQPQPTADEGSASGQVVLENATDGSASPTKLAAVERVPPAKRDKPMPAEAAADAKAAEVPLPASGSGAQAAIVTPPAPKDFATHLREGRAALDKGNLSVALASFQAAVALRPLSAEAITGVARCQAGSEDAAAAIKSFERAVTANPNYAPAWSGLAHLRETTGNRDGAIDAYRRVVEINPDGREGKTAREALADLGATEP